MLRSEVDANGAMLYNYKHSFSGFSAKLNASQAMELSRNYINLKSFGIWMISPINFSLGLKLMKMNAMEKHAPAPCIEIYIYIYIIVSIAEMEEVISVFESKTLQLHTTRSWDFLGLPLPPLYATTATTTRPTPLPPQLAYGDDVVVGVFDSGLINYLL